MPDRTVLVVDDSAVNLRLADILLRKEGFIVHVTDSAENAIRVLRSVRPDLMLVDIQLPGMDGLELARRTKQDPQTQDIVVLALTASTGQEQRDRAAAAGCSGYITKPIDTRTFAAQIREHMASRMVASGPEASPMTLPGGLSFNSIEIESLRRRFLEEGTLQSRQMLFDLGRQLDAAKGKQLVHRWIGSAGALGYGEISSISREAEAELSLPVLNTQRVREVLTNLVLAFTHPREAEIALPEFITKELAGLRIGLVDFEADDAERLCSILDSFGARPRLFNPSEPPLSDAISVCNAILVHVRASGAAAQWLAPNSPEPNPPVILVGARDPILALHPSVQARASEFLIDGWQPEEALMRLKYAISRANQLRQSAATASGPTVRPGSGDRRVLIADDDEIVVSRLRTTLESQGIECWTASNGFEAETVISRWEPHAAVLDVNMPGKSGFELLSEIRAAGRPLRVLLLTAAGGENNVLKGFNLGADDYVVKPFSPAEVAVRLKRMLAADDANGTSGALPGTKPGPKLLRAS